MNEDQAPLLHQRWLDDAARVNADITQRFAELAGNVRVHRTHHYQGRFENTYIPLELIPQLQPVVNAVLEHARKILGLGAQAALHYGFWFNEMGPGHVTSLHNHDEDDELLSACYYLQVPPESGCFVAIENGQKTRLQPEEGMLLLFSPQLMHEVEKNRSGQKRLSVAFNIGRKRE